MSGEGKPSDLHPRTVAHQLGLRVPGGQINWSDLLAAAVDAYWDNRPGPDRGAVDAA